MERFNFKNRRFTCHVFLTIDPKKANKINVSQL